MADGIDLGKKAGPLPIGAWVVVVGGGLAIGFYFNRKNSKPNAAQTTESGTGLGGQGFETVLPNSNTDPKPAETNQTWGKKAGEWLVGLGNDAGVVDNAIRKYLFSLNLTIQEQALVNQAIVHFGLPPEALSPVTVPKGKPPAVINLKATQVGEDGTKLTWDPSPKADSYDIAVTAITGSWNYTSPTNSFTNGKQYPVGLKHSYTVYAVNDEGRSPGVTISFQNEVRKSSSGPSPSPSPAPPPQPQPRRYTISGGDTLTSISVRFYGTAARWLDIYNANAGTLDGVARTRGKSSSRGGPANQVGWWIFPGTVIVIP